MSEKNEGEQLMTYGQVAKMFGISVRALYRLVASGEIPKPIQVSARTVRFAKSEIDAHLASLMANRGVA